MKFNELFKKSKPLIACIHLLPLPGSPRYGGSFNKIIDIALHEASLFCNNGADGLIIENFRDNPFCPDQVPAITVTAMTAITREIAGSHSCPVGINVLRNDAIAAISIAAVTNAHFIRVNVHTGAFITDQGIIQGKAHETLRLRTMINKKIMIFTDAAVKHAAPLGNISLSDEIADLTHRGMSDAIILTGNKTGSPTNTNEIAVARQNTHLPVIIGSGITPENLSEYYHMADGFIVGSYFKKDGIADNEPDEQRIKKLMAAFQNLRNQ